MFLFIPLVLVVFLQRSEGVEIALKELVLDQSVFLKLALGVITCNLRSDAPGVLQHFPLIRCKEDVETLRPSFHCHCHTAFGAAFR